MTSAMVEGYVRQFNVNQLIVTLSNTVCSNVVYTAKIMALTCSVLGTYYVLSSHDASLIFTIFFAALSFDALAFYTVSCHKVCAQPGLMRVMKKQCSMMLNRERRNWMASWEKKVGKYRVKAMPTNIGMKDGGFRTLEGVSTLEFIDFYVNQVIALLLL